MTSANADYMIYITTKHGRTWKHLKENNGWTRTGPNRRVHRLSAEQLLSHLLPPLAGDQPGLSVRVERREMSLPWGRGRRLSKEGPPVRLTVAEATVFGSGVVLLTYHPAATKN
jgi:hypothetical protein